MTGQTLMSGHLAHSLHRARSQAAAMIFGSSNGCFATCSKVSGVRRFNSRTTSSRQSSARTVQARQQAVGWVFIGITPRQDAPASPVPIAPAIRENVHCPSRYIDVTNASRVCRQHGEPVFAGRRKRAGVARVSRRMGFVIAGFSRSFLFRRASR